MARSSTVLPEGKRAFKSFKIGYHFDNPTGKENIIIDSGLRFYATQTLRPYDIGTLQLGDGVLSLITQKLPKGKSQVVVECPSSCTEGMGAPITVFNTQLVRVRLRARAYVYALLFSPP